MHLCAVPTFLPARSSSRFGLLLALAGLELSAPRLPLQAQALPAIADKTKGLEKRDGFVPLRFHDGNGQVAFCGR